MSIITTFKEKFSKAFYRKDKNYRNGLLIGILVAVAVAAIKFCDGFYSIETYLQTLIYQYGYKLPETTNIVTIVKKDQTTSSLINKDPGRSEYASLINFLGSTVKADTIFKSRSQTYEMLNIELGYFEDIRNQRPITTSYDEWSGMLDKSENTESLDQNDCISASRQVIDYFKINKDKPGFVSFIRVSGKSWLPKGGSIFKVLAGGSNYLMLPTLCVPWASENVINEVKAYLENEDCSDNESKPSGKSQKQGVNDLLERWINFFSNIQSAEVVFDVKLMPTNKKVNSNDKTLLAITMKLKTYARDTSYEVKPASVIGFDFVLQGEKDKADDQKLLTALQNTSSRIILAAHSKTETITDEGAADERAFTQAMSWNVSSGETSKLNQKSNKKEIAEDILIKPSENFLTNKKQVDYAMIDMSAGAKSFVTEVPLIIKVNEDVYENGVLIATQTIKPSFALRVALESMDYEKNSSINTKLEELQKKLSNLKPDDNDYSKKKSEYEESIKAAELELQEPDYVAVMGQVFKEIRKDFCEGRFAGGLKIKDLFLPVNDLGRLYLNYAGSTRKGTLRKAAIDSVSLFECFEDDLLKEHLRNNPKSTKLTPTFAHRRVLGGKHVNKGGKVFVFGPFESTDFDFYPTPVSYETPFQISKEPLMGIEIHANAILNIINKNFIRHPNDIVGLICFVAVALLTGLIFEMVSPFIGAILALLFLYASFCYSFYSYHTLGQIFHITPILTAIVLTWLISTLVNYLKQRAKAKTTKEMFSKFVSADVVKYMLDNPDQVRPGGTKTELTIFFSDVAGFTTISEGLSPEDLVVLLNEYLGAMTDLLFEYGGTLDKFIGDAVMAFWNFPKKQEDHAVKAVLCAIAMQKKIKELQIDWARRGFPKVAARCGINTQDVVVGYMGSQKAQMNFTCMGDGVNLASRLEGANKEYGTMMMVSDNTYQRVKHAVRGRFLDFLAVKGKKEPVKVHELVCKIGDEPEGWFERTELYNKAIQLHLERKWDEAIATFEEVLKLDPNDGPSKTYITRCNEYKVNPPPEGWDGRYILTHK